MRGHRPSVVILYEYWDTDSTNAPGSLPQVRNLPFLCIPDLTLSWVSSQRRAFIMNLLAKPQPLRLIPGLHPQSSPRHTKGLVDHSRDISRFGGRCLSAAAAPLHAGLNVQATQPSSVPRGPQPIRFCLPADALHTLALRATVALHSLLVQSRSHAASVARPELQSRCIFVVAHPEPQSRCIFVAYPELQSRYIRGSSRAVA